MDVINSAKAAIENYTTQPSDSLEDIFQRLYQLKEVSITLEMLQTSEIGKSISGLKKTLKDNEVIQKVCSDILSKWKDMAKEAVAAKKRKREELENGKSSETDAPPNEKKFKLGDGSTQNNGNPDISSTLNSSASSSNQITPAPTLVPISAALLSMDLTQKLSFSSVSIRKDLANRIAEPLKNVPVSALSGESIHPNDTAIRIESSIFDSIKDTNETYKTKIRSLIYHLKKNESLRASIVSGEISPERVANLTEEDLISEDKKAEMTRISTEVDAARKPIPMVPNCPTENCPKCGGNKVHVTQAQTRSSDEPMTQFFTCIDCHKKWKK